MFSEMLKYLRMRENLSQAELAQKLQIAKSTISMYEVGKREPDFETLETIADFFNVDMNFLLGKASIETFPAPLPAQIAAQYGEDMRELFDTMTRLDTKDKLLLQGEAMQMLKAEKYQKGNATPSKTG